jgi:hypothetical protein
MKYRLVQSTGKYSNPKKVLTRWARSKEMLTDLKDFLNKNDDDHLYMIEEV